MNNNTKININITTNAYSEIYNIIKNNNNHYLIFIVEKSGCYGYSYSIKLLKKNDKDLVKYIKIEYKNIEFLINKNHISYINNLELDYIENQFYKKFIFKNKKYKNICGCGKSFSVKNNL